MHSGASKWIMEIFPMTNNDFAVYHILSYVHSFVIVHVCKPKSPYDDDKHSLMVIINTYIIMCSY